MAVAAASVRAPTTASGDAAQFLDIDMQQIARARMLIVPDLAQLLARGRVQVTDATHPATDQDAMHRNRRQRDTVLTFY